jgi:uncharacterized lipoprotein YajG
MSKLIWLAAALMLAGCSRPCEWRDFTGYCHCAPETCQPSTVPELGKEKRDE